MSWITITDNFQVYSLRDDFLQFFDWGIHFLENFTGLFLVICAIVLVITLFISLAFRLHYFDRVTR